MDGARPEKIDPKTLAILRELERKVLWLSTYMIHHANHEVDRGDGLKVGGHQASSASLVTLMTALYFHVLRPEDRVAVKPHAGPVFHAIQYLLGNQTLDKLQNFRGFGGAQSYPSRTKDKDDVDFSTGSVGLGVAMTGFASLIQDYVHAKWRPSWPMGRMVALMGDAEIDEGNVHEALLEFWKHGLTNAWWIVDYNRQSLDSVVSDRLFMKVAGLFENLGWKVVLLKYGKLLEKVFAQPGGQDIKRWIDDCPNQLYSALVFQGGPAWRKQLEADLAGCNDALEIIRSLSDAELARLMTNLGGHDLETILETFAAAPSDQPVCFIAYTIKGFGLPFQGHKDNHAGLMTKAQMQEFRASQGINQGEEWEPEGRDAEEAEPFQALPCQLGIHHQVWCSGDQRQHAADQCRDRERHHQRARRRAGALAEPQHDGNEDGDHRRAAHEGAQDRAAQHQHYQHPRLFATGCTAQPVAHATGDAGTDQPLPDDEKRSDQHDAGVGKAGQCLVYRNDAGEGQQNDHDQPHRIHPWAIQDEHGDGDGEQKKDKQEIGVHDVALRPAWAAVEASACIRGTL